MKPRGGTRALAVAALGTVGAALLAPSTAWGTRFRRPIDVWNGISAHFDNNAGGAGCRDYNCGTRCYDNHHGTDFRVPLGTSIFAVADGRVSATNNGCPNFGGLGNTCGGQLGNYVFVLHADGNRSVYGHMQLDSIVVKVGDSVRCGQMLGRSASSGSSTGPHLHLAWRRPAGDTDSFRGMCTTSPGAWVDQAGYGEAMGTTCENAASADAGARPDATPARDTSAERAGDLGSDRAAAADARSASDATATGPEISPLDRDAGAPRNDRLDAIAASATNPPGSAGGADAADPTAMTAGNAEGCGCRVGARGRAPGGLAGALIGLLLAGGLVSRRGGRWHRSHPHHPARPH